MRERCTGFLDTQLNSTCNSRWMLGKWGKGAPGSWTHSWTQPATLDECWENEGKVHRVLGHTAELNLQLSMNVGKMRERCTGFLDTQLNSTCNSRWMLGKWGKGASGSWTQSWTQPATLDECWENEGQVHQVPGHTAEHNLQHSMKVGKMRERCPGFLDTKLNTTRNTWWKLGKWGTGAPGSWTQSWTQPATLDESWEHTHTHTLYLPKHTHTVIFRAHTHTHTHTSKRLHTHSLSSSSTHIFLLVFLLLLLVHPQAPLPVQVLDDASSQSDVVASHGLVHRQAVDRPHPLLQLAVQRRSQLTVPQLRQNKGGHQLMLRTLLLWKLVTHIVTVTRWSSPCNCYCWRWSSTLLLFCVTIESAHPPCYYLKCPPTLLLFKVPTHLVTVKGAHPPGYC